MKKLTRNDVDLATLYHYLKTLKLRNPPNAIIPPPIKEYEEYKYLLNVDQPYNESKDYWGKSVDMIKIAIRKSLEEWEHIKRVGVWLSGGFDSALLLKLTSDIIGPEKVRGYNVIWSENKNELEYAQTIVDYVGTSIKIVRCDMNQIIPLFKESCLLFRAPTWCPQVLYLAKICADDGTNKVFCGLGLDALSGGEYNQATAKTKEEFRAVTLSLMDRQRDYIWANKYHAKGYVDLKMPFFDRGLVNYMLSLPKEHKVKDMMTRIRLRDEVADLGILPAKIATYGKVAGTKRGFGPDWNEYLSGEYSNWASDFNPEQYININMVNRNWRTASFWTKLPLISTCKFYELLDEGRFIA